MRRLVIGSLCVCMLAACGGSSHKSSSSAKAPTGPTTTVKPGNDQASTPFCKTLKQINSGSSNSSDTKAVLTLVNQAETEAPASIQPDLVSLANYLQTAITAKPNSTLPQADQAKLIAALTAVETYATEHCGIVPSTAGS